MTRAYSKRQWHDGHGSNMGLMQIAAFLLLIGLGTLGAQSPYETVHEHVKEEEINNRRFKHAQIEDLLHALPSGHFRIDSVAASIEGRAIYHVQAGRGPTKILLWSQMHGNEPTATMALMDIFNYLSAPDLWLEGDDILLDALSLHFIPMLNPDGADRFARRNSLFVDINRDALRAQSPEGALLKQMRDSLRPDWGFNLHDQNRYTSAGKTPNTASISFLAPAYNEAKDWDEKRRNASDLIAVMNAILQHYIPNQVGRYSDEFEPRAFGDNIQKWGTRTILIETGGLRGDLEKQHLRKLNFIILLEAFRAIARGDLSHQVEFSYDSIPYNSGRLHELIVRNAQFEIEQSYTIDIAFRTQEVEWKDTFWTRAGIVDLGDVHNYYGYEEFNADGLKVSIGKVAEENLSPRQLSTVNAAKWLGQGYTYLRLSARPTLGDRLSMPDMYLLGPSERPPNHLDLGYNPSLVFRDSTGSVVATIINGILKK